MAPKKVLPITYKRAHHLRHNSTQAEARLWTYLRSHRLDGVHFRRQHAVGKYIVDFCAPKQKFIIELDGSQHLDREMQDEERSGYLATKGFTILRIWNNDVMNNIHEVMIAIDQALGEVGKK